MSLAALASEMPKARTGKGSERSLNNSGFRMIGISNTPNVYVGKAEIYHELRFRNR